MNRRAFIQSGAAVTSFLLFPAFRGWSQNPAPDDDQILSDAEQRIDKHRKADRTIRVQDSTGRPLPGLKVSVEQTRHDFLFGCNFFMFDHCGDSALEKQYRERFADLFNYCTLGFYWANYEARRGSPNYSYTDRVVDWCRERGITCKGHPLVWDHPAGSPKWLPEDPVQIEQLSKGRVRDIVSRYKGRIDIWDVVNEATHLPDKANQTTMARWALARGPEVYVGEHLEVAREANPGATLLVNDYRTDPPYYRLLESVQSSRKPFNVVGIQSHMHDGAWKVADTWSRCERFAKLGLPIHFTETTLVSGPRTGSGENWGPTSAELEEKQADGTGKFYTVLFSHPAVQAITWWDFSDRGAWQRAAAGWLRKDMTPKPVYTRMNELIKVAWWTKSQGETGPDGAFRLRAFHGDYRIRLQDRTGKESVHPLRWGRQVTDQHFTLTI